MDRRIHPAGGGDLLLSTTYPRNEMILIWKDKDWTRDIPLANWSLGRSWAVVGISEWIHRKWHAVREPLASSLQSFPVFLKAEMACPWLDPPPPVLQCLFDLCRAVKEDHNHPSRNWESSQLSTVRLSMRNNRSGLASGPLQPFSFSPPYLYKTVCWSSLKKNPPTTHDWYFLKDLKKNKLFQFKIGGNTTRKLFVKRQSFSLRSRTKLPIVNKVEVAPILDMSFWMHFPLDRVRYIYNQPGSSNSSVEMLFSFFVSLDLMLLSNK